MLTMEQRKVIDHKEIERAAEILKRGGVGAFPTETVYGLGGDGLNREAVARIFYEKERPSFDPLILHIANLEMVEKLVSKHHQMIYKLAEKFWPGPLTVVAPKKEVVPDIVSSALPTVAIRMPNSAIALKLIELSGGVLAAPSANKFGKVSPTSAQHVAKELPNIDFILDGGRCSVGIESTVIALSEDGFTLLRKGVITSEEIEKIIPLSKKRYPHTISSPGMLNSHYSPDKPLYLAKEGSSEEYDKLISLYRGEGKSAFISFSGIKPPQFELTYYLSKSGDIKEAAVNLFDILHTLQERSDVGFMVAEPIPGTGIAEAIRDKLKKASYRYAIGD